MIELAMLLPVLLPALFWAGYHYYKDRHLPEPAGHLVLALLLGGGAAVLAKGLYVSLGFVGLRYDAFELAATSPARLFAYALLAIGPVEEFAKLLPFLVIIVRFKEFDDAMDGIIYASFVGLGFAAAENLYYLQFLSPLEATARGFASPVVHMAFASIWGHQVGLARMRGASTGLAATRGFAISAILHGVYDFIVLLNPTFALPVAATLIVVIWVWRLKLLEAMHLEATAAGRDAAGSGNQPRQ